ncbi:hypothetical protein [Saccharicrinis aurantiacus]|uniref:hypothetical protein n=1 Tax=Saccharicrinis aurantiacus TaxID=1849719 RepID=UPI0024912B99|nr:hypothetical protein [Saccharicrinis aurantiacus]
MPNAKTPYNLFQATFNHIVKLVDGIERIIGIYNQQEAENVIEGIGLKLLNNRLVEYTLNIDSETAQKLILLQKENNVSKWVDRKSIPFEQTDISTFQKNIFDEYKHLILLLKIPQSHVETRGLIFIYFKDDISHFGVHHTKEVLNTQNKSIIASLISGSVFSFIDDFNRNNKLFSDFAQKSKAIITKQHIENKILKEDHNNNDFVVSWAHQYLAEFSNSDGVNYVYNKECIEFIQNYKGPFLPLQKAIAGAVEYTKLLFTYVNTDSIEIELSYLQLETEESRSLVTNVYGEDQIKIEQLSPRLLKTKAFLDKLEETATWVYEEGISLTSSNVGKSMERPITAAAISDFLSKNKERINILIKEFPNDWAFIKENFRPVINVTSKKDIHLRNLG